MGDAKVSKLPWNSNPWSKAWKVSDSKKKDCSNLVCVHSRWIVPPQVHKDFKGPVKCTKGHYWNIQLCTYKKDLSLTIEQGTQSFLVKNHIKVRGIFANQFCTATFTINRHLGCLWSKVCTFQLDIELCKWTTMPILNWGIVCSFSSRSIKITRN